MNLTVSESDSKNAILSISGHKVKLKVNRTWSFETRQKVIKRATHLYTQVSSRNIGYTVSANLCPDSMNNPVVFKSSNKTSPKVIKVG